jgi:hypothetical protein
MLRLRKPIFGLVMVVGLIFATCTISTVRAYAESIVLNCTIIGGSTDKGERRVEVYGFDQELQTLRREGSDCRDVVITPEKIKGTCNRLNWTSLINIDRTNGQIHLTHHRSDGFSYDEDGNCRKPPPKKTEF